MPARLPYFIPEDLDLGQMPTAFREAVENSILPAYRELVVRAPTSLERAAGMTFCFDMWLELLEQCDLVGTLKNHFPTRPSNGKPVFVKGSNGGYRESFLSGQLSLDRYQSLGARKEKIAKFLLQFRIARARWGRRLTNPAALQSAARLGSQPARETAAASPSEDKAREGAILDIAEHGSSENNDNLRWPR